MNKIGFANVVNTDTSRRFENFRTGGFEIKHDLIPIQTQGGIYYCGFHTYCSQNIRHLYDGHVRVHYFSQYLESGRRGFLTKDFLNGRFMVEKVMKNLSSMV